MLMLPPVSRINRITRRDRRVSQVDDAIAREDASDARAERVDPIRPAAAPNDRPERRKGERRKEQSQDRIARAAKPYAPLVAQLVATALGLSQTRARRRAAVSEALAAYGRGRETPGRSRGLV